MQRKLDSIKTELIKRIYTLFIEKYGGNKLQFAKAANCDEKTIRKLFDEKQGMTINLLFKICFALDVTASELLNDLELK